MTIYRGYTVEQRATRDFIIRKEANMWQGFESEEAALTFIDKMKREEAQRRAH